jgi:virulence-associated protein VapD
MYAIAFDMNTAAMGAAYPNDSWRNGYKEIEEILSRHGFIPQQRSVYYGNEKVDQVACVLAVQDLANRLSWFADSVDDIRMLQLLPNDDLKRALTT